MSKIASLEDAAAYLEGLINMERRPRLVGVRQDLSPIRALLQRLGNPERALSILHVAGSKGKGSTCLFAESLLRASGERVGTFTSPHLVRWTERFRIGGEEVGGAQLAAVVGRLRPHVEALRSDPKLAPTFFDATTAAALMLFAEANLDRVILEVGLGGRLDSTNAVSPAVTVVTSIELEHTDKLGDTVEEIAGEKAGILKPGIHCVVGRLSAAAGEVVAARARALGAPLLRIGREFDVEIGQASVDSGTAMRYRDEAGFTLSCALRQLDRHQAENAALAVAAVRRLPGVDDVALVRAAEGGLPRTRLPGRCELVGRRPWLVVDSAHTEASARGLARVLDCIPFERLHLVLSVSEGKQVGAILEPLLMNAASVTTTRADPVRSLPAEVLADRVRALAPEAAVWAIEKPQAALRCAADALQENDALCVAGSIYLAGQALDLFVDAREAK